jgi:hypothetical protein
MSSSLPSSVEPVSPAASPPSSSPLIPLLFTTLVYAFLFSLVTATQYMPVMARWGKSPVIGLIGMILSLGPFTILQILLVRYITAWQSPLSLRLSATVLAAIAWIGLLFMADSMRGGSSALIAVWINLALIATTVLIGSLISFAIKETAVLLPVLLVSGLVDYWGVYFGTTHQFVQHAPKIVEKVSAKVPTISFGGVPVVTTIGPGDFVFLGIFFACLYRFHLDVKRTFWLFAVLLLVSLFIVTVLPINIPGLVPMAIAMIAVNGKAFKLSRAEIFATVYVTLFLALILVGLSVFGPFRPRH